MKARVMVLAAALALVGESASEAAQYTLGDLTIGTPWARASTAANGAAYMTIENHGTRPDQLTSASSPVAGAAELHTHVVDGEVMRMRPVKAIEVNVGEPAVLKPGGLHVMLLGLKAPLTKGERFPLTLTFADAGSITIDVKVEGVGAGAPEGMGSHQQQHHQHH